MIILKVTKKQTLLSSDSNIFWNMFLGLLWWGFLYLDETSTLVFTKLSIFHSVWIRMSPGKIVNKLLG